MGNIRILPENLISKIAAGEIVERPSSIVKELIENSLDARSDSITIELKSGGKRVIRVSDNGMGMNKDDAMLSIERHATSKIKGLNDLFSIHTLGFRGEALPSIAGISKFVLSTRIEDQIVGTRIHIMGGVLKRVEEIGCPRGTMIESRDLFYNTPPRLKFLKSAETELRSILEVVQREALSNPGVRFQVLHDDRLILSLSEKNNIEERLKEIIPDTRLYKVSSEVDGIKVCGFLSGPEDGRSTSQRLYIYVNSRSVRDRFLTRVVIESHGRLIEKGRFPQGMISITIPTSEVDVNVHPTKNEVRFRNPFQVGDLVKSSVLEMLKNAPWIRGYHPRVERSDYTFYSGRKGLEGQHTHSPGKSLLQEKEDPYTFKGYDGNLRSDELTYPKREASFSNESVSQNFLLKEGFFSSLKVIGQIGKLYIVCESENGMILIDQHAAHERVNFEKLKRSYLGENKLEEQSLLVSQTIDLSPYESELLSNFKDELKNLGIVIEEFGKGSFVIRSVPALLKNYDMKRLIMDVVGEISTIERENSVTNNIDKIISTIACHSSVRANEYLNIQKIYALLTELDNTEFPHSCPHGRPVAKEFTFEGLDRMFKRT